MMSRCQSIVTAGFFALDAVRYEGTTTHHAGGTAANVAANLASLGWRAAVVGRIGDDAPARLVLNDLRRAGVETTALECLAEAGTPVVIVELGNGAHRFSFTCPVCRTPSARSRPMLAEEVGAIRARFPEVSVFFFDRVNVASIELARRLRADGTRVVFEPSAPGGDALRAEATRLAHVVKLSSDTLDSYHDDILRPRPGQLQVVTNGANGLRWRVGDKPWREQTAFKVVAVDSCGAGDWLTAGLLSQLPEGTTDCDDEIIGHALRFGQGLAAYSCMRIGAAGLRGSSSGRPARGACNVCARMGTNAE